MSARKTAVQPDDDKPVPFTWRRLDEAGIRQLAEDILAERVFLGAYCPPGMLGSVFMPLVLGMLRDLTFTELDEIGQVWAYLDRAAERWVDGLPSFFSCNLVHRDDWAKVAEKVTRCRAAMSAAMEG